MAPSYTFGEPGYRFEVYANQDGAGWGWRGVDHKPDAWEVGPALSAELLRVVAERDGARTENDSLWQRVQEKNELLDIGRQTAEALRAELAQEKATAERWKAEAEKLREAALDLYRLGHDDEPAGCGCLMCDRLRAAGFLPEGEEAKG